MKMLDLFSGIGGFSLAAEWAGIETVAFCERDLFCQKVLKKHWADVPCYDDVKDLHWTSQIDLLTAGFPCQPFSVAGKKKGIEDERYLWAEVIRIIRECKPTWIILENVPGIIPHLDPIIKDLENENYDWGGVSYSGLRYRRTTQKGKALDYCPHHKRAITENGAI